jgi:hypothetical protein
LTRRKYKVRAAPVVADEPVAAAPASPVAPGPASPGDGGSPLTAAMQAQQHAEQLQAQHQHRAHMGLPEPPISPQERQAIDNYVESIPNLTPHQQRFLKAHPSLMKEPFVGLVPHAIMVARHAGIADDTDAMDHAILSSIARDVEHHRHLSQLTSASARLTPENREAHADVDQHVAALQGEAQMHLAAHQSEHQPAPPPSPKQRRSIQMSAPPSRGEPSFSGRPDLGSNSLSAEERQIARNSFSDPHMSNAERELLYLRNRNRYRHMKADGSYSSQGEG